MEEEHVPAVAALARASFSEPWSENAYRSELTNPQAITLVALRRGWVVGFVNAAFAADVVDINSVAVEVASRRCGIASRLLRELEAWVSDFAAELFLEVRESNQPAQALYASLGFSRCGSRPRYYHAPDEDGVLMKKVLAVTEGDR